jgi:hypothetical protein
MTDATYDNLTINTKIQLADTSVKIFGIASDASPAYIQLRNLSDGGVHIKPAASGYQYDLTLDAGKLQLTTQGASGGLVIGGDTTLYRSASNTLKTTSNLIVGGSSGSQYLTIAGGTSDGTTSTLNFIDTNNYVRVVAGATSGSMQIAAYTNIGFFTNHDYTNIKASLDAAGNFTVAGWLHPNNSQWGMVCSGDVMYLGKQEVTNGISIDASGNATVAGSLTINTTLTANGNFTGEALITSHQPFYTPASYDAWLAYLNDDNEGTTPFPNTTRTFHFADTGSGNYTDLAGGLWKQENGFPQTAPFVLTRHHLVVKKDFFSKGQVVSYEGCLTLYGGHAGWITGSPYYTNNPIVLLGQSSTSEKNCLEIRTGHDHGYGGLICGVVSGQLHQFRSILGNRIPFALNGYELLKHNW